MYEAPNKASYWQTLLCLSDSNVHLTCAVEGWLILVKPASAVTLTTACDIDVGCLCSVG
jgi:hypothetical protein